MVYTISMNTPDQYHYDYSRRTLQITAEFLEEFKHMANEEVGAIMKSYIPSNKQTPYKPLHKEDYNNSPGQTVQINALWQEIKALKAEINTQNDFIKQMTAVLANLDFKFSKIDFEDMNDKFDDLKSRIDLLDE
jgi:hypothetical protein